MAVTARELYGHRPNHRRQSLRAATLTETRPEALLEGIEVRWKLPTAVGRNRSCEAELRIDIASLSPELACALRDGVRSGLFGRHSNDHAISLRNVIPHDRYQDPDGRLAAERSLRESFKSGYDRLVRSELRDRSAPGDLRSILPTGEAGKRRLLSATVNRERREEPGFTP